MRRDYVTDFDTADAAEWTLTNGSAMPGQVWLTPWGGTASAVLAGNLVWKSGRPFVHVGVEGLGGNTCEVQVSDSSTPGLYTFPLATGTNEFAVSTLATPPTTLDRVAVVCTGAGATVLDWLTLSNGGYAWAPMNDLDFSFSDAAFPGGGFSSVVVAHHDAVTDTLYAGMEVGGLGVSYDGGLTWEARNGRWDDWLNATALGVWGITVRHETTLDRVFALTGDGTFGGLWMSTDDGGDWTLVTKSLGAYQHADGTSEKSIAAGMLLVEDVGNVYVANQLRGGTMGVHVVDASNNTCQPYGGLPNTADPFRRDSYIPTALATGSVANQGDDTLFVGYRVRVATGVGVNGGAADPSTFCWGGPCTTASLHVLQRRVPPGGASVWRTRQVQEDSLFHPVFTDLDWSGQQGSVDHFTTLWIATSGGGILDGAVSW